MRENESDGWADTPTKARVKIIISRDDHCDSGGWGLRVWRAVAKVQLPLSVACLMPNSRSFETNNYKYKVHKHWVSEQALNDKLFGPQAPHQPQQLEPTHPAPQPHSVTGKMIFLRRWIRILTPLSRSPIPLELSPHYSRRLISILLTWQPLFAHFPVPVLLCWRIWLSTIKHQFQFPMKVQVMRVCLLRLRFTLALEDFPLLTQAMLNLLHALFLLLAALLLHQSRGSHLLQPMHLLLPSHCRRNTLQERRIVERNSGWVVPITLLPFSL